MQYSLGEVLRLTVFSMIVVFLILAGIMCVMMIIAKIFGKEEEPETQTVAKPVQTELNGKELFTEDPLARAAAITALAEASEEDGKKFKIVDIKRVK